MTFLINAGVCHRKMIMGRIMTLWTIIEEEYWDLVCAKQDFDINSNHARAFGNDYQPAYKWMQAQVAKRVGDPSGDWPLWAWTERPDMRSYYHNPRDGQRLVMLKLEVPSDKILLSRFEDWHMVLNDSYLPSDEEDKDESFEWPEYTYEDYYTKMGSWERIFDIRPNDKLQACIDNPKFDQIKSFEYFKGRVRK